MRRLKRDRMELVQQIKMAAHGIANEPAWPSGAPTQAEVQALADELEADLDIIRETAQLMRGLRHKARQTIERTNEMVRRIDGVTSAIYGIDDARKGAFGLRQIDTTRNTQGPTPKVAGVRLTDGLAPGSVQADWRRVPRAVYEVQWFFEDALSQIAGSAVSTRSSLLVPGLAPGTQVWLRVRALRSKKHGEWSDTATRIANV